MLKPQLKLSFVKTSKPPKPDTKVYSSNEEPKWETLDTIQLIQETAFSLAKYAAVGLFGWVVLDTARQCAVKATPQR